MALLGIGKVVHREQVPQIQIAVYLEPVLLLINNSHDRLVQSVGVRLSVYAILLSTSHLPLQLPVL